MKKALSIALMTSLSVTPLIGCASSSSSVSAQYVSEHQYSNLNCDQIALETRRISARVSEISGQQDDAATADAVAMGVGLIVFWPALFALALTDDQEAELGRLKGEYEALERAAISRGCHSGQPSSTTVAPTSTAPQTPTTAEPRTTRSAPFGPGPRYQAR
ncbi:MAG: hypothetical protein Alpg2KO_01020 [Alphaproteobacteria bacterium]